MRPEAGPERDPVGGHLPIENGEGPRAAEEDGQPGQALHRCSQNLEDTNGGEKRDAERERGASPFRLGLPLCILF